MYAFEATILSVNQEKFNFTNYKLQQVKALLLSLYLDPTKSGHSYTFIPQSKYRYYGVYSNYKQGMPQLSWLTKDKHVSHIYDTLQSILQICWWYYVCAYNNIHHMTLTMTSMRIVLCS